MLLSLVCRFHWRASTKIIIDPGDVRVLSISGRLRFILFKVIRNLVPRRLRTDVRVVTPWKRRVSLDGAHAQVQHAGLVPGVDENRRAADGAEHPVVGRRGRVDRDIALAGYITEAVTRDTRERSKGGTVQSAALRTMAVAEILDRAVCLEPDPLAFTTPGNHLLTPRSCLNHTDARRGRESMPTGMHVGSRGDP